MDVVYVLGSGSHYNNFELRVSLRSVEKNLTGIRSIWVVGEKPDWVQNINHIPFPDDISRPSDYNIMRKVTAACEHPQISENFLFINDDHYILQPFNVSDFPYFHEPSLEKYLYKRGNDTYAFRAKNTLRYLQSKNLPTKHFDIHYPIIYNKSLFLEHVTNAVDWTKEAYVIKSMYANTLKIEGVEAKDYKIGRTLPPEDARVISTTPRFRYNVQRFLLWKFKDQSKYEH